MLNTTKKDFEIEKSPMRKAYILLHAHSPIELFKQYLNKDQQLIKSHRWDYKNPRLIIYKVKAILEKANPDKLTKEEKDERNEILWLWYHHSISYAVWKYKDRKSARNCTTMALKYQIKNHPNRITRLLHYLVHCQLKKAEKWSETITTEPEKSTAVKLIKFYKDGGFFS